MILLYSDRHGELRVVLTMRAKTLRSCTSSLEERHEVIADEHDHEDSGQAALPGGKSELNQTLNQS